MSKGTKLQAMALPGKEEPTRYSPAKYQKVCALCDLELRSANDLAVCDSCGAVYEWLENGLLGYIGKRVLRGAI